MSNHFAVSYSRTPRNNTIYLNSDHHKTTNDPYRLNTLNTINATNIENIAITSSYPTYSSVNRPIFIFTKTPNTNVDNYKSSYGFPFECVELIRRILSKECNYTFASVIDAEDMFYSVNTLYNIHEMSTTVPLITYQFPYGIDYDDAYKNSNKKILSCLRPGNILFWRKTKDENFIYGHVAIIISANDFRVTLAQQNSDPPIKNYNTAELVDMINQEDSQFIGIKVLPKNLSEYLSHKLKNIQIKHFDV